ncbi:lysophospholipase L1-like esterase [Streptomyces achromogenes]|uniref:Lysophospholipase L1-like esterase n=1 Tax=Streptomyces achromogenes TaxID=67255 RepID=A0ABU0PSR2_STRAH|nr:SGNH/GDSL hydrolase family protein [Streptomyces achromogenes]MDQ0681402.1 lysophospholipase L1-like esterase [Streptomyces achromogenes]MDQ0828554.1 lysophospholipase L1-like esterase [Streptomyces achromogenes]
MRHDVRTGRTARRGRKGVTLLAALGSCALVAASAAPVAAHGGGAPTRYVALGDSYTSAPLVPRQVDAYCARSDHNYPSVVAGRLRAAVLKDVSCGGATTEHMWKPQGVKSPQLDAVGRNSDIVSVQIGGNDIGFGSIIGTCAQLAPQDPTGNPCQRHYSASGVDELTVAIARTGPKVARVLRAVHDRAPHARVLVVGYPDLLPDDGSGCAPSVPFATRDFPYLRDTGKRLNLMLRLVARWSGAEYVDTYGPTVGHDMCKPAAQRWIEPLQPASPAAPAHPNAKGEEAMAGAVFERLSHRHGGR